MYLLRAAIIQGTHLHKPNLSKFIYVLDDCKVAVIAVSVHSLLAHYISILVYYSFVFDRQTGKIAGVSFYQPGKDQTVANDLSRGS